MSQRVELRLVRTDTVTHRGIRRGPAEEVKLPTYEVLLDGEVVGQVARRMFTRETGPATRPYVSNRWESPGWAAEYRGVGFGRRYDMQTRTRAVREVLANALGTYPAHEDVEALAAQTSRTRPLPPREESP